MLTSTELGQRRELLARAIETGSFGFMLLNREAQVLHANRAACELLEGSEGDVIGQTIWSLLHADDRGWAEAELEVLLAGGIDRVRFEARFRCATGGGVWAEVNARAGRSDDGVSAVVMLEDVGDRVRRERELRRLADTDPLTDLYNRRRFAAELERHLARTRRYGSGGALLLLDIDSLKRLNDLFGHLAGDRAIVDTAAAIRSRVRASDVIARVGGDEFAVLLPAADQDRAAALAHALLRTIRTQREPAAPTPLTVSIGIATMAGATSVANVFGRADAAMYAVKRRGGDGYEIASPDPTATPEPSATAGPPGSAEPPASSPSESERSPEHDHKGDNTRDRARQNNQTGSPEPRIDSDVLLRTIAELGSASVGLLAWELYSDTDAITPTWSAAIEAGLLERDRYDQLEHEWEYRITTAGRAHLHALDPDHGPLPRRGAHQPTRSV